MQFGILFTCMKQVQVEAIYSTLLATPALKHGLYKMLSTKKVGIPLICSHTVLQSSCNTPIQFVSDL